MKRVLKSALLAFFHLMRPSLGRKASILMYHSVGNNPAFFTVKEKVFEKQICYLVQAEFKVVFLTELVKKILKGESVANHVAVTFDDGYEDFYTTAFPILRKHNLPSTLFVPTGLLGASYKNSTGVTLPIMNEVKLLELVSSGIVECMPHGVSHEALDRIPHQKAVQEIDESNEYIKRVFKNELTVFSYPKGRFTPEVVSYLKTHGFAAAVTVSEGLVSQKSDPYLLPRNSIDSTTTMWQFKAKLSSAIDMYVKLKKYVADF